MTKSFCISCLVLGTVFLAGCGDAPRPGSATTQAAPAAHFTGEAPEIRVVDPAATREKTKFNIQPNGMSAFSLLGKHFEPQSQIVADGKKLLTAYGNPEWISAEVPESMFEKAHTMSIKVINRDGKESNVGEFKIASGK